MVLCSRSHGGCAWVRMLLLKARGNWNLGPGKEEMVLSCKVWTGNTVKHMQGLKVLTQVEPWGKDS